MSNANNDLTLTLLSLALKGLTPQQLRTVLPEGVGVSLMDVDSHDLADALRARGWEAVEESLTDVDLTEVDSFDLARALRNLGWEAVAENLDEVDSDDLAEALRDNGWEAVAETLDDVDPDAFADALRERGYLVGTREMVIEQLELADYVIVGGPSGEMGGLASVSDDLLLAEVARRMKEGV